IDVLVGDAVKAGQLLVRLDCRYHESQLAAAGATLAQLQAQHAFTSHQLQRALDLQRSHGISEEDVEQRESEVDSLDAQLKAQQESIRQAEIMVGRCQIHAPFAAVVTERLADVGSLADTGTPLLKLVQTEELDVSAELREPQVATLMAADKVQFAYSGRRHALRLRQVLPVVDSRTRTREARLSFVDDAAPAGAAGRLTWQGTTALLPAEYLVRRGEVLGVFYVNGSRAHFHPLPDAIEGQPASVELAPDTVLVAEGRQRLVDGDELLPRDRHSASQD
ncbi:MAG: efflux RND transporter periplasmic adaptor subunit, partial [Pseudomonadota bacterium]